MRNALLALTAVAALVAGGCGERVFDQADLQEQLSQQLGEQAGAVPEVACPSEPSAEEGATFDCTGTAPNGDEFTIEVEATGDDKFEAVVPPQQFK
jgi:Domain of unknown function (DUF4333)